MLTAFALAYITCITLSLAMNRHFQQILPNHTLSPRIKMLLRNGGWLLLIITLLYCAKITGVAVGLVLLLGLFSACACMLAVLLHYLPRAVLPLAVMMTLLSFI